MSILGKRDRDENHNETPSNKKVKLNDQEVVSGLDADSSFGSFPNDKAQEIVILNVGGIKYITTIQTLTGYNSMLKARFSSKYAMKPLDDGSYFIDRDGKLFKYILEYFRNGQLLIPTTWNNVDIWKFYNEVKYYCIESLFKPILLKLFYSKMIQHDLLKMKILEKLASFCKDKDINTTLNNLKDWELMYEYDASKGKKLTKYDREFFKLYEKIERCLVLIEEEIEFRIFGMLLTHGFVGCVEEKDSFAFECGIYSSRIPSYYTDQDIKVSFEEIRKFEFHEWLNESLGKIESHDLFPFVITANDSESIGTIIHRMDGVDDNGEVNIHKVEIWFVPMY